MVLTKEVVTGTGKNKKKYRVGDIFILTTITAVKIESSAKKDKFSYTYDITSTDGETALIKGVPRTSFTTFYIKDIKMMDDIHKYHLYYRNVVKNLDRLYAGEEEVIIEEQTIVDMDAEEDE